VRLAAWEATGLSAAVLVAAGFLAVVIPYRNWDALDIGSWSRTIAAGGFHHGIDDFQLQKPLFYVAQGLLWRGIGYHEAAGRILSLSFSALLAVGVWILAGRLTNDERARRLLRAVSLTILLASSAFTTYAISGLSDIPLAAATCGTAVLLTSKLGRARVPLVAAAAAATVLAKPSGLIALSGLALACGLFLRDKETRRPAVLGLVGIALGSACARVRRVGGARARREPVGIPLRQRELGLLAPTGGLDPSAHDHPRGLARRCRLAARPARARVAGRTSARGPPTPRPAPRGDHGDDVDARRADGRRR
jgi:hypothetical protein